MRITQLLMKSKIIISICIIVLFSKSVKARESYFWVSLGIGSSTHYFTRDSGPNMNMGLMATYQIDKYLFTLTGITTCEPYSPDAPYPYESITNNCLIFSRCLYDNDFLFSAGLGPGLYTFSKRGKMIKDNWPGSDEFEKVSSYFMGGTIQFQLILHGSILGVGGRISFNYSNCQYYMDYLISLSIGKISRPTKGKRMIFDS